MVKKIGEFFKGLFAEIKQASEEASLCNDKRDKVTDEVVDLARENNMVVKSRGVFAPSSEEEVEAWLRSQSNGRLRMWVCHQFCDSHIKRNPEGECAMTSLQEKMPLQVLQSVIDAHSRRR